MLFSLILFAILLPCIYLLGQPLLGLPPQVLGYTLMALFGIPVSAIFVVPDAIVAAVSDLEERLSGQRREAILRCPRLHPKTGAWTLLNNHRRAARCFRQDSRATAWDPTNRPCSSSLYYDRRNHILVLSRTGSRRIRTKGSSSIAPISDIPEVGHTRHLWCSFVREVLGSQTWSSRLLLC